MVGPHRDKQPSFQVLLTQQTGGGGNGEEEESEGEGRQREEGVRVRVRIRGLEGVSMLCAWIKHVGERICLKRSVKILAPHNMIC